VGQAGTIPKVQGQAEHEEYMKVITFSLTVSLTLCPGTFLIPTATTYGLIASGH
jgi:hypothetical protein